jgi:hypothetical protein
MTSLTIAKLEVLQLQKKKKKKQLIQKKKNEKKKIYPGDFKN